MPARAPTGGPGGLQRRRPHGGGRWRTLRRPWLLLAACAAECATMAACKASPSHPTAHDAEHAAATTCPRFSASQRTVLGRALDRYRQQRPWCLSLTASACPASLRPLQRPAARRQRPRGAGQALRPAAAAWRPAPPCSGGRRQRRHRRAGNSAAGSPSLWQPRRLQTRQQRRRRAASSRPSPPCLACPSPTAPRGCASAALGCCVAIITSALPPTC